jgi:hypothetical protein
VGRPAPDSRPASEARQAVILPDGGSFQIRRNQTVTKRWRMPASLIVLYRFMEICQRQIGWMQIDDYTSVRSASGTGTRNQG